MKTLLFTLEYPPFHGGIANYYGNLVKNWPEQESIFVLDNNKGLLINNKLPVLKWLPSFFALWQAIRKNQINHVIVGQILPLGTVVWLVSKIKKIDYSIIFHGMDLGMLGKSTHKNWLAKKIMKNAKHLICNSGYTAQIARVFLPESGRAKISIVNPGVNEFTFEIDNLKPKNGFDGKIVLFSIGRLVKRKGFDKVIEALPKIIKEVPELIYVIAGAGEEEGNLKREVKELGLNNHVIFLGSISEKEKWNWLSLCDIFIMPARNIDGDVEGFGIVYLEANSVGKSVVAGESGGVVDAVENGLNGLLVDPLDIDDISFAVIKLAKDKELRDRLGKQGQIRVREFAWQKQVDKFYKILNDKK